MTPEHPVPDLARRQAEDQQHRGEVLKGIAEFELSRLHKGQRTWDQWLPHAHRHGRYGFTNTLLIAAQSPGATEVRSYDDWRRRGRQVRRGETAIRIVSRSGRPRPVFDIAQTDGPQQDAPPTADPSEALQRLQDLAKKLDLYVDRGQRWLYTGRADRRIPIPTDLDDADAAALLAHQLAHVLRRGERVDAEAACHGVRRVRADSIAYLVLAELGLQSTDFSFPPVQSWAGADPRANPRAAIKLVGESVLRIASRIRRWLADIPPTSYSPRPRPADAQDALLAAQAAAHEFYRAHLTESWAPTYLAERGFDDSISDRWQLGYAPAERNALVTHLSARGFTPETLVTAGLAKLGRDGTPYDLFRDRLMFPLRTPDGAVVGFIGRRRDEVSGPKYLNTPETPHFRKGELLFGLHEGRVRLAQGSRPLIVEGPLDAIAVESAAIEDKVAVAPCGTAITAEHIDAIARHANLPSAGMLLALDGDGPGGKAMLRAWNTLRHLEGPVDAIRLPHGKDPADILRYDGYAAVRESLQSAVPLADLVVDATIERAGGKLEFAETRVTAARAAAGVIAQMKASEAARQVTRVADRTGLETGEVTALLTAAISPITSPASAATEDFPSAPLTGPEPTTTHEDHTKTPSKQQPKRRDHRRAP